MDNLNFLEVTIDPRNGSSDPRVKQALERSTKLLGIMEFIKVIQFKMDTVMFDYFWEEPKNLKMAIMQLKTQNGDRIRQYYIDIETLLKLYTEYTLYFNYKQSQRKTVVDLEQIMAKLDCDRKKDREILNETTKRQEHYIRSLSTQLKDTKHDIQRKLETLVGNRVENRVETRSRTRRTTD